MRGCRLFWSFTALGGALLLSGGASAEAIDAEIECEPNHGYYLCEATPNREVSRFSWSVSGDLSINVASGPLVSVGCREGESGAVQLEMDGPDGAGKSSVTLECERGNVGSREG